MGDELTRIFSLLRASEEEPAPPPSRSNDRPYQPNWAVSLTMVQKAAEALRASADRVHKMEARTQELVQRATKELEGAHARIESLETRLRASEAREKQAEARAREAEEWLRRIHEAITEALPSGLNLLHNLTGPDDAPAHAGE